MKIFNPFLLLFLILIVFVIDESFAQTKDSVTYGEERKDTSDYRYRRLYQYLDINMKDEKTMFKISPDFSISKYYKGFGLKFSYEQKVYKQFSFLVNTQSGYSIQKNYSYNYWGGPSSKATNCFFQTDLGAGMRWYYTLNQRIKNGASGNNLSGMYAEVGLDNIALYSDGSMVMNSNGILTKDLGFRVFQTFDPYLAIGFQRRFNNWSYYDLFAIVKKSNVMMTCDLGFRLGFAWGNNK